MKVHLKMAVACCCLAGLCCRPAQEPAPEVGIDAETVQQEQVPPKRPAVPAVWNTYHGKATLDGVADAHLPDELALRWRFKAGAPVYATPVASAGRIHFVNAKGQVFAVDHEGNEVWSKTFTRGTRSDGSPIEEVFDAPLACFGSTVVAGSAYGIVYALDAATGDEQWQVELEGTILGTPNAWTSPQGRTVLLVVEQDYGVLHGLDLADGARLWKTEGVERCDGSPSVGNGVVVFGSCAAALHVFSAEDGTHLRDIEIDGDSQVAGGVALVGDSVYSGSRSGKVLHANTKTGKTLWVNQDTDWEVFTTPAVNDDRVVYASEDGNVYALDRATGSRQWAFPTQDTPSSPVIAGDKAVITSDGTLFLLRLESGEKLWSYEVSDTITSPAVVGDLVVVGSDDGTVAAFGP